MKSARTLATLVLVALLVASASPAAAASPSIGVDAGCARQVQAIELSLAEEADALERCTVSRGLTVGPTTNASLARLRSDTSLSAEARAELTAAAAAGTVKARTWSQFTTGGGYTVTHGGTFYYTGTRVWATASYSGYKGSHNCVTNYAVLVTISQRSCNESGSTTSRSMYNSWTVAWLVKGSPVSYDVSMTATLTRSGGVSGFGTTWS